MKTDETESRIVLQPETEVEQALLSELFQRLNGIVEAPSHPEKVGSTLVYYTLDLAEFTDLDHSLWAESECGVNEHGKLDPEPGSRALVVYHGSEPEEATQEEVDEAVEALAEDSPEVEVAESPVNPSDYSVGDLEDAIEDEEWTAPELRGLYEAEVNRDARVTALRAIESALDDLTEQEVEAI